MQNAEEVLNRGEATVAEPRASVTAGKQGGIGQVFSYVFLIVDRLPHLPALLPDDYDLLQDARAVRRPADLADLSAALRELSLRLGAGAPPGDQHGDRLRRLDRRHAARRVARRLCLRALPLPRLARPLPRCRFAAHGAGCAAARAALCRHVAVASARQLPRPDHPLHGRSARSSRSSCCAPSSPRCRAN